MKSNLRIQRANLARKEAVVFLWFAIFCSLSKWMFDFYYHETVFKGDVEQGETEKREDQVCARLVTSVSENVRVPRSTT